MDPPTQEQHHQTGQLPLQLEPPSLVPSFHHLVHQAAAAGKAHGHTALADSQAQAQTQGHVSLAGAAVAYGGDVLPMLDVFEARQLPLPWSTAYIRMSWGSCR